MGKSRNGHEMGGIVMMLILGLISLGIMICGLTGLAHYEQMIGIAPAVSGTLTGIEEYEDSEGDIQHYLLVEYDYDGVHYRTRYDSCSYKEGEKRLGEHVTFRIDPENHGELMHRNRESSLTLFYAGLVAWGMMGMIPLKQIYKARDVGLYGTYGEIYGMNSENIMKDLIREEDGLGSTVYFTGAGLLLIACGFLLTKAMGGAPLVFGIIALIMGLRKGIDYVRQCEKIRTGGYRLRSATIVDREIVPDSDGPDDYYLHCISGGSKWRKKVPIFIYDAKRLDDRVQCVFKEGQSEPAVVYWNVE